MSDAAQSPAIKVNDKRRFINEIDQAPTPGDAPSVGAETPPAASAGASEQYQKELEQMTRDLEAARKRVDELARAYQASERDREEFKVRMTRERERMIDVERGNVAVTLLEAIDDLDLCVASADESALAKGVRLIRDGLLKKAETTGIERVELAGKPFDPNLAEASDMELTTVEADDGQVVSVSRACYQLKGRVVRPGRVKVAKYVKPADA